MEPLEYMLGENSGVMMLQFIIIMLALIILFFLYSENGRSKSLQEKIDNFKCPDCPVCPKPPNCPDCNCSDSECPACVCEGDGQQLECPACPECPTHDIPSVDDIVDAIFPGRNRGMTAHGEYFPLHGLDESQVEPAYSPVINMMPNYMSGTGVPATITYDETLTNPNSSIGIASQLAPPTQPGQGLFTEPSPVEGAGVDPKPPTDDQE